MTDEYEGLKELEQKNGTKDGHVVFLLEGKGKYFVEVQSYVTEKKIRQPFDTLKEAEKLYNEL